MCKQKINAYGVQLDNLRKENYFKRRDAQMQQIEQMMHAVIKILSQENAQKASKPHSILFQKIA